MRKVQYFPLDWVCFLHCLLSNSLFQKVTFTFQTHSSKSNFAKRFSRAVKMILDTGKCFLLLPADSGKLNCRVIQEKFRKITLCRASQIIHKILNLKKTEEFIDGKLGKQWGLLSKRQSLMSPFRDFGWWIVSFWVRKFQNSLRSTTSLYSRHWLWNEFTNERREAFFVVF